MSNDQEKKHNEIRILPGPFMFDMRQFGITENSSVRVLAGPILLDPHNLLQRGAYKEEFIDLLFIRIFGDEPNFDHPESSLNEIHDY